MNVEVDADEENDREVGPAVERVPVEAFRQRLEHDPALRAAFEGLTPGRRREDNISFSDAEQASTRVPRTERYAGRILDAKGLSERARTGGPR